VQLRLVPARPGRPLRQQPLPALFRVAQGWSPWDADVILRYIAIAATAVGRAVQAFVSTVMCIRDGN
jgi:hypothetical protein